MNALHNAPRLAIAGLAGDSGKSIVSLAILYQLHKAEVPVSSFKKGPDYIDAAWLSWASGRSARNLDTWLMGFDRAVDSFREHAAGEGLNLIEGNRGLFDGSDAAGTHSTAELAKALQAPVLMVMNVAKMTRTAGALVLGCQHLDPKLNLAGVIINRVHGVRHESVVRASIEAATGLPVVGAIPVFDGGILPDRHLGLVTPSDYPRIDGLPGMLEKIAAKLDIERILKIAASAPALPASDSVACCSDFDKAREMHLTPKIAVIRDAAFNFYYPENLEALTNGGADLVFVSSLEAQELPEDVNAIYIGGGFPEVHAAQLSSNAKFLKSLAAAAACKIPVYAECGGLMLLARTIEWQDRKYPMAGVLPIDVVVEDAQQGHGYVEMTVTDQNPFYPLGTKLRGHEFHYSRIIAQADLPQTACAVCRGTGTFNKRDGVVHGSVWASYTHLHASASSEWAIGLLRAARAHAFTQVSLRRIPALEQNSQPSCLRAG